MLTKICIIVFSVFLSFSVLAGEKEPSKPAPKRKVTSMQLPLDQSVAEVYAVLVEIKKLSQLQMSSVSKISLKDSVAKVDVTDEKGLCRAYAFQISADRMGLNLVARPLTDAVVICE